MEGRAHHLDENSRRVHWEQGHSPHPAQQDEETIDELPFYVNPRGTARWDHRDQRNPPGPSSRITPEDRARFLIQHRVWRDLSLVAPGDRIPLGTRSPRDHIERIFEDETITRLAISFQIVHGTSRWQAEYFVHQDSRFTVAVITRWFIRSLNITRDVDLRPSDARFVEVVTIDGKVRSYHLNLPIWQLLIIADRLFTVRIGISDASRPARDISEMDLSQYRHYNHLPGEGHDVPLDRRVLGDITEAIACSRSQRIASMWDSSEWWWDWHHYCWWKWNWAERRWIITIIIWPPEADRWISSDDEDTTSEDSGPHQLLIGPHGFLENFNVHLVGEGF